MIQKKRDRNRKRDPVCFNKPRNILKRKRRDKQRNRRQS